MSIDWTMAAVIGCEIPVAKLHTELVLEPGCAHTLVRTNSRFCSECGAPARKVERSPIAGYDEDEQTLGAMSVAFTTDNERAFAGYVVAVRAEGGKVGHEALHPEELASMREAVRVVLEPLGLWDAHSFGLYAVPRCSY